MQANDPKVSNQEKTIVLNVMKKALMGDSVEWCYSHVHSVGVPQDRNPYFMFTATEKKSVKFYEERWGLILTHAFMVCFNYNGSL